MNFRIWRLPAACPPDWRPAENGPDGWMPAEAVPPSFPGLSSFSGCITRRLHLRFGYKSPFKQPPAPVPPKCTGNTLFHNVDPTIVYFHECPVESDRQGRQAAGRRLKLVSSSGMEEKPRINANARGIARSPVSGHFRFTGSRKLSKSLWRVEGKSSLNRAPMIYFYY
jgi:hypothetical protein